MVGRKTHAKHQNVGHRAKDPRHADQEGTGDMQCWYPYTHQKDRWWPTALSKGPNLRNLVLPNSQHLGQVCSPSGNILKDVYRWSSWLYLRLCSVLSVRSELLTFCAPHWCAPGGYSYVRGKYKFPQS